MSSDLVLEILIFKLIGRDDGIARKHNVFHGRKVIVAVFLSQPVEEIK
jgi:hypothetical protein